MNRDKALDVLLRGITDIVSLDELKSKLAKGRPLNVKLGVDPTAPDLHLGHTVILRKLRQFQDLGHQVTFIVGDFTARIGDPSGRDATRPMLSADDIRAHAATYTDQVFKVLDRSRTRVVFNSEWLGPLGVDGVLRLCSRMTVARMLERDDFSKRYAAGAPITILEFIYPLMQGQDSVAIRADVELGGNDQKFNLMVGRDLQKDDGQEPQVIITMPLLEGLDGTRKMSKSYGNYVSINEGPREMFGKLMSIPDALMPKYYELLTDENMAEVGSLCAADPRNAKIRLAACIVAQYHGADAARREREEFERVFSRRELPADMPAFRLSAGEHRLVELLTTIGFAVSRAEAKRLVAQGAVRVNGEKVTDGAPVSIPPAGEVILQVGKLKFGRLIGV
jgi:tyrosyl-tRNA synthetase